MNILLVCNSAFMKGNGLSTAVCELQRRLVEAGHNARIISGSNFDENGPQPYYQLGHFKVPIFEPLIRANGFSYASIDRKLIRKAVEWADIVHIEEAFPVQIYTIRVARKLNKPCVATFHIFTENIMANLGMGIKNPMNRLLMWIFNKTVFRYCSDIHCPSEAVRRHLEACGYKSRMHVITNGMVLPEETPIATKPQMSPYIILCIGRLSREKSQETLLDAMRYSKYSKEIQLIFAGHGKRKKAYQKICDKLLEEGILTHEPVFNFYSHEEISELAKKAYLYIHCAWVEVEGLSCLDAIKDGTVPVIGSGDMIATAQFALEEQSLYPARDSKALAERIDWWIEHPEHRMEMGQKYIDFSRKYNDKDSTAAIIEMYKLALKK